MLLFAGCNPKEPAAEKAASDAPGLESEAKPAFLAAAQPVSKTFQIPAELLPYERAGINAKIEAFVKKVNVDIGDRVKSGEILAILDAPEVFSRYSEALARLQEARARFSISRDRYARLQEAAKKEGAIAAGELVSAKNQMLADSAVQVSLLSNADAVKQLQEYLVLRAPFSGVITSRHADQGDLVGTASSKEPMLTLERTDMLRLRVPVPESFVAGVPVDKTISFKVDAIVNKSFQAALSRKSGRIDPDTRTEIWEYAFSNPTGELKPGMYAIAELHWKRATPSFIVPFTSVVTTLENRFVSRIRNGQVEWVDVRQGISLNDGMEVFGDLTGGDTILVRGSEEIKPGTPVAVRFE